jgi:hypothetical protein
VVIGSEPPSDDAVDLLEDLDEMPLPEDPEYEQLVTGYRDVNIKSEWDHGRPSVRALGRSDTGARCSPRSRNGFFPQT